MSIHLLTMVGHDVAPLEHLLFHYVGLGIDSLNVCVELESIHDPTLQIVWGILEKVRRVSRILSVRVRRQFDSQVQRPLRNELIGQAFAPNDWIVYADGDEFQAWGGSIPDVLSSLPSGVDHVRGHFVDRIARQGDAPAVDPGISIWKQFPLEADIVKNLMEANALKVVAFKASTASRIVPGQHYMDGGGAPAPVLDIEVHHFKWYSGIEARLQKRKTEWMALGRPWWTAAEKALKHLEAHGGRWDLSDPALGVREGDTRFDVLSGPKEGGL